MASAAHTPRRARKALLILAAALAAAGAAQAGDFTWGGKVFANLSEITQRNARGDVLTRSRDAELKRLFLDGAWRFDDAWSFHATTDINWLRGANEPDLWLRHFYLERAFANGSRLRFGVDDMPMMSLTSKWHGYRYVEQGAASIAKIESSADWGIHARQRVASGIEIAAAVVTGGGFKRPRTGERADVEILLAWQPDPRAVLAVAGYEGELAARDHATDPMRHNVRRVDALAAFADPRWRLGVRYAYGSNYGAQYMLASERTRSLSAWASIALDPKWSLFTRVDRNQPRLDLPLEERVDARLFGIEWKPVKALRLAAVAKRSRTLRAHRPGPSRDELGFFSEWSF